MKLKLPLVILLSLLQNSCSKKKEITDSIIYNDTISVGNQIEIEKSDNDQIKEILLSKVIKFQIVAIGKDKFGNRMYDFGGFTPHEGKFDFDKNEFLELNYYSNDMIPQKFVLNNDILTLHRKVFDNRSYRTIIDDKTYKFNLSLKSYGILAMDNTINEGYCGMIIYNTVDYERYNKYYDQIKNDFDEINNIK